MKKHPLHISRTILSNGITLVTERVRQFESLAIGVWVKAGTRHELDTEEGMSHFLEHMMFKGTHRRSPKDIALAIDRVGGELNAFTAREHTCFHVLLRSNDVGLAVEIFSDILLNSQFDATELDRERKVILQEISMVEDNPEEYAHDLFFEQAYGNHAIGKAILGTEKSVSEFTRKDVLSYFQKHYSPRQLVISVCGDIDHKEAVRLFEKALGKKLKASRQPRELGGMAKPKVSPSIRFHADKLEQVQIIIGFPGPHTTSRDRYAANLLTSYLGGSMSSVLFQEIREKRGLAYSVYATLSSFVDTGLFSIYIGTDPKETAKCISIVMKEINKLRARPMSKQDLTMIKESIKGMILLSQDSVEARMMSNARAEMYFDNHLSVDDVCKAIDKITIKDIHRIAKEYFDPKQLVLTVLGAKKPAALSKALRGQIL